MKGFTMEREEFLGLYRHSMAHILAKAVIEIYGKEVQYAIGPQIDDGCYYDFVLPKPVTQDDFKMIEDKMREIIKRREDWTRKEVTRAEALELFKDQKFKTELINDLPEWESIFDEDKRKALYKEEKASHTIRKENKVYPNDPCPCGSGKKYKKCHGRA